ncbi:hypothetical protein SUGI_0379130 [Cryptomeria japonica]|nr:hypothetical protein SUGI_0379130 [Cryptomeria japonica]
MVERKYVDIDLAGRWSDVAKDKNLVIHCKAYMCNRLGSQTAHCEGSVKDSPIMNIQLRLQDPNINTPFEWNGITEKFRPDNFESCLMGIIC